ncbi:hypothetical protein BH24GEM3_BH24GEM3_23160 [soil metagenome]
MLRSPVITSTAALLLLLAPAVRAQDGPPPPIRIECVPPATLVQDVDTRLETCHQTLSPQDSALSIVLRIPSGDLPKVSAMVRFEASHGVLLPASVWPDSTGLVHVRWHRKGAGSPVEVVAEVNSENGYGRRHIRLAPPPLPRLRGELRMDSSSSINPRVATSIEQTAARDPVVRLIRISGDTTIAVGKEECTLYRAAFVRGGVAGTVTPDTAPFEWVPLRRHMTRFFKRDIYTPHGSTATHECRADAEWALGAGVGGRSLRITVLPIAGGPPIGPPQDLYVHARRAPTILAGIAYARDREYITVDTAQFRVVQVEEPQVDGSKRTYQVREQTRAPVESRVEGGRSFRPTFGVVFPSGVLFQAVPFARNLTFSAAFDLTDPTAHQYFGLSLLHLFRPSLEMLPLDLQLVGHTSERRIATTQGCSGGATLCTRKDWDFDGIGIMGVFDVSGVLSEVLKKLAGG